jgi:hypothetical protein
LGRCTTFAKVRVDTQYVGII